MISGLCTELAVIQICIESALCQQFLMITLLDDVPILHDQNDISLTDGGQSVGNDEGGASFHHAVKGLLNLDLGTGIDGRSRLIQNQHGGKTQHDTGDTQQLLLTLGQAGTVLSDKGVVALRQAADKAVGVSCLGRCDDFLLGGVGLAHDDIVPDGAGL